MKLLLQLLANGLVNGALYAMLAVGFGIVWRSLKVFHVSYGGIFLIGAYTFYGFAARMKGSIGMAGLLAVGTSLLAGWFLELALYRPLYRKRASPGAVMVAGLGALIVTQNIIAMLAGNELKSVSRRMSSLLQIGPVSLTELQVTQFLVGITAVGLMWIAVQHLHVFKALWAMGDQPGLIPVLGLPLFRLRNLALIVSSAMATIPACLITLDVGVDPNVGMSYLLIAAVAVLAGGPNLYAGWVTGGVALAVIQSLVIWKFSARWMDLFTFGALVVMLIFRPYGLFEHERRLEENT